MNHYGPRRGFLNNNSQLKTNPNLTPPTAYSVPPVQPGSGITQTKNVPHSNPRNINNNPAWLNTYDHPYSLRVDVYIMSATLREEDTNKKTSFYIYTAHILATPPNVTVRQIPLDLDNGIPCVALRIGKTNNDDTITFLSHVDTCAAMNTGNLLFHKYIMTKHP